jgi:hypothetical protein
MRYQAGARARERYEPHPTSSQPRNGRYLFLGGSQRCKERSGVSRQRRARFSEAYGPSAAYDQRRSHATLEPSNVLADCWLAIAELSRGAGERACLRDRPHHPERRRIQHVGTITNRYG